MNLTELTDDEFARFRALIYRVAGIRIAETKRVLVSNRVRRRLRATGIESFAAYYAFLTSPAGAGEMPAFLDAITTNETYFFRDQHHYDWLGGEFLPRCSPRPPPDAGRGRCGSGRRRAAPARSPTRSPSNWPSARPSSPAGDLTVLGTDLSGAALDAARAAVYDERALQLVDAATRKKRFDADPRRPKLDRQARRPRARHVAVPQPAEAARRRAVRLHLSQERADLL